ncbi:MAG: hypothetical protein JWO84_694 [Parcubacteria group bacterium]|nr:hypothetical protein [Parcubacteria group bacterium]
MHLMGLLLISFIAGVLTVLAPCILPLLPVIVGDTLGKGAARMRAPVVILSLGVSIFLFTLILKVSTTFAHVPAYVWTDISGVLITFFGVVTLFPNLWDTLPGIGALNRSSNKLLGTGYLKKNVWGDALIGAALGPVFSSCSPTYFLILATVLPVNLSAGLLYLAVYTLGLCLSLFLIALIGQRLVGALGIASDPRGLFKRTLGVLFILVGIAILFGIDKKIEASLLANAGALDVTQIEQRLLTERAGGSATSTADITKANRMLTASEKALRYQKAPELAQPDAYLNTGGQPISLAQYRGKNVVLIDFWTYSCINCQRTLPYLTKWYAKYKDQGLVIIGVHTPEFAFEHVESNVAAALKQFGITYPVVLDNEYRTWNAFNNQFWPREYLIDIDGYIVHDHAGEGEYDVTEKAIQEALAERAQRLGLASTVAASTVSLPPPDLAAVGSPETYFGAARNEFLGNGTPSSVGTQTLAFPDATSPNTLYLRGTWNFSKEYAETAGPAGIRFLYKAHDVYLVASAATPVTITVLRDGKPVGSFAGSDVNPSTSTATISEQRLYRLVHDTTAGVHTIEIQVSGQGFDAYTFSFG